MPATIFRDTIFALSSGRLPSGVAVVRMSGGHVKGALEAMVGSLPEGRRADYRAIRSPRSGEIVDRGLVLLFEGPHSFTGEDCAELHVHGGKAVVAAILAELSGIDGFRHAEAGEFTRRAFLNGKLDLVGAEALADLIGAETEAQRRFAAANAEGQQTALYAGWRKRIIHARAMIEAELDFADESDVPGSVSSEVWAEMAALAKDIDAHLEGYRSAEIIRDGYQVVILGAPNAGKSSLLNALARREVAIVTEEPGTTRDLVEVALDLDGMKVVMVDTAGIREAAGRVESIGIERALERARRADLVLELIALDDPVAASSGDMPSGRLRVGSKSDLGTSGAAVDQGYDFVISVKSGEGLGELLAGIARRAAGATATSGEVLPSRMRHVELLHRCASSLRRAAVQEDLALELRAEELRDAGFSLGKISGAVDVEDLLDTIFSEFCIGK
ncbi:tRNA uridine-5-carboxymethylaminomethyl(34) synthesis GTPase MnmE [Mesorhizobium sp. L-8-10]|uniref:tRNA uridine-5-carboxymethylaminomethyl(34) synthesis GTPase MnmE n=1 Tax=Mesorhizobium sp. L-8-10 TaxID=2744523 RepID=UPI00192538CB|nr:tRNA uridine-5-carboxymethylaminomethyl(34) synthesis GTPase MnmE [Mesorhizobium sp. L-8-10]